LGGLAIQDLPCGCIYANLCDAFVGKTPSQDIDGSIARVFHAHQSDKVAVQLRANLVDNFMQRPDFWAAVFAVVAPIEEVSAENRRLGLSGERGRQGHRGTKGAKEEVKPFHECSSMEDALNGR
jgi:hypothetical protein